MKIREFFRTVIKLGKEADEAFEVKTSQPIVFHIGGHDLIAMGFLVQLCEDMPDDATVGEVGQILERMKFWHTLTFLVWAKEGDGGPWKEIPTVRNEP